MSCPGKLTLNQFAEVDATDFFADESINWRWCCEFATFEHKESCEFIVHIGEASDDYAKNKAEEMRAFGCTADFIAAYQEAAAAGAVRVVFYA